MLPRRSAGSATTRSIMRPSILAARSCCSKKAVRLAGNRAEVLPLAGLREHDPFLDRAAAADAAAVATAAAAVNPEQPALIVYTSGSTGAPKGALIRHAGLVRLGRVESAHAGIPRLRLICNLPIDHIAGLIQPPPQHRRRRKHMRHPAPCRRRPPRTRTKGMPAAPRGTWLQSAPPNGLRREGEQAVDGDQHPAQPVASRPRRCPVARFSQQDQPRPAAPESPDVFRFHDIAAVPSPERMVA